MRLHSCSPNLATISPAFLLSDCQVLAEPSKSFSERRHHLQSAEADISPRGVVGSKSCLSSPAAWGVILGANNRLHGGWRSLGCLTSFCLNSVFSSEQRINRCCLIIGVYCAKGFAGDEVCMFSFYGWKAGFQSLYVRSLHASIKPHQGEGFVLLGLCSLAATQPWETSVGRKCGSACVHIYTHAHQNQMKTEY